MSDRAVNDLCRELQPIYREWKAQCNAIGAHFGWYATAIVTWRNAADQNKAKAAGLTNASAGDSPHNCCNTDGTPASKAFDFGIFEGNGHYIRDGADPRYRQCGEIGKALGLAWGGNFKSIFDPDHFELPSWRNQNNLEIS